jgi:hypothetical protein
MDGRRKRGCLVAALRAMTMSRGGGYGSDSGVFDVGTPICLGLADYIAVRGIVID